MRENTKYEFLQPKRGSNYRQLFVNGRIRAEVLYRETVGQDPMAPEQVAEEYNVPLPAVHEAIEYCIKNKDLLDEERTREEAWIRASGHDKWPYAPTHRPVADEPLPRR